MFTILTSILAFIVVFAIVVIVHEFGHFWVARQVGVRVLRFSVGFGPILWRTVDKQGCEYALAAIPLGGYIKMLDGRETPLTEEEKPFAFDHKPVLSRIAVVIAGPLFNFLFAIIAYTLVLMVGVEKIVPIIADVLPDSPAAKAGLQIGDQIVSIDGKTTLDWQSVYTTLLQSVGDSGETLLQVRQFPDQSLREYSLPNITLNPSSDNAKETRQTDPLREWGITLGLPHIPAVIGELVPSQPAELAGLQAHDEIIAVDDQPVRDWYDLVDHVRQSPAKELVLTVKRDNKTFTLPITPLAQEADNTTVGVIGVKLSPIVWPAELMHVQREGPLMAFHLALLNTWDLSKLTFTIMAKMVTGKVALENLAGPISIAQGAQQSAQGGWNAFVSFLILLSVNLGVINLLPIPMLDGGHLLYYVIEWIRGRPVSEETQRIGLYLGIVIVLTLTLVGLHNDVMGLWH